MSDAMLRVMCDLEVHAMRADGLQVKDSPKDELFELLKRRAEFAKKEEHLRDKYKELGREYLAANKRTEAESFSGSTNERVQELYKVERKKLEEWYAVEMELANIESVVSKLRNIKDVSSVKDELDKIDEFLKKAEVKE